MYFFTTILIKQYEILLLGGDIYMKRKIIPQGPISLGISLPMKWVKKFNLKKGDELNIDECGNKIALSTDKPTLNNKAEVDSDNADKILTRMLGGYYRGGVDDVTVRYSDPTMPNKITTYLNEQTIGYEVVKQTSKEIIIKDLSGAKADSFDAVMQRSLHLLKNMCNEAVIAILKKDKKALENMYYIDRNINKFTNFALRTLIKSGAKSPRLTAFFYYMLRCVEETGDCIRNLCLHYKDNPVEISKQAFRELEIINCIIRDLCNSFYKKEFAKVKMEEIIKTIKKSRENIDNLYQKDKNTVVLFKIRRVLESANDMIVAMIETKCSLNEH